MAIPIKSIPVPTVKASLSFNSSILKSNNQEGAIEFTKQLKDADNLLGKDKRRLIQ